ncbi:MAG TPA: hypothetical protein VE338_04735 [Ktedonobacterales bacterium]|jgi:hypothetical protein|nr:hypothetical protein [Ktedonobacterales bacterium]
MSEQERRPRMACERYAPTLALLDDASTDPDARAAALDHLAGCVWCRADQRVDNQIDDALRRAFGPASAPSASPLHTSDLLAAIGATSEPAATPLAMPRWASARPTGDAIRSVIYLGDFDDVGGFDRMSDQDERDSDGAGNGQPTREDSGSVATSARRMAAIPSLRPAPRRQVGRQAMTLGFSATAVAVALIVVAVTLFGSRGRAPTRTAHAGASATQTARAQRAAGAAGAASLGPIVAISMDAPNDGWALGDATPQSANGEVESIAALYHYDGATWTLKQRVKGFPIIGSGPASLTMLSPSDGWAFTAPGHLIHYDGTAWHPITISIAGGTIAPHVLAFDMVSSTEGWAAVQGVGQTPLSFLRYDGQQWKRDASAISLTGLTLNPLTITGISAASRDDVWAVGYAFARPPQGTGNDAIVGLIFHRVGGVWQVATRLNAPTTNVANLVPRGILMLSPTSGWIVGDSDQVVTSTQVGGSTITANITHSLLLHYDGVRWAPVSVPLSTPSDSDQLSQIIATGPDSVWVMATSNAQTILPSGVAFSGDVLHYDGTAWSEVRPSVTPTGVSSVMLTALSSGGDGTLWAVGLTGLVHSEGPFFCRYAGGAWQIATPVTSGS